jgi:aarF domain-containing kinase
VREYSKEFMDSYIKIIYSAAVKDKENCIKYSKEVGFLTGDEN